MGNAIAIEPRIPTLATRKLNYLTDCAVPINHNVLKQRKIDCLLRRIRCSVEIAPWRGDHRVVDVPYFRIHLLLQSPAWKLLKNELAETYGLEIRNLELWQRDDDDGADDVFWDLTFNLQRYDVEK